MKSVREARSPTGRPPLLDRVLDFALPRSSRALGVRLRQEGEMRLGPTRPWASFTARQRVAAGRVAFAWRARLRMGRGLRVHVTDGFERRRGHLSARLWGLLPVASARGETVDRAEVQRYLAELPWCPWAYAQNPDLSWQQIDEDVLVVRTDVLSTTCTVAFDVDDEGRVLRARAERPRAEESPVVDRPWVGTFEAWTEVEGARYPARAAVAWDLPEGRFEYWRGRVTRWGARGR